MKTPLQIPEILYSARALVNEGYTFEQAAFFTLKRPYQCLLVTGHLRAPREGERGDSFYTLGAAPGQEDVAALYITAYASLTLALAEGREY